MTIRSATIFLVKDGPSGDGATDEGHTKPIDEIALLLGLHTCQFLGTTPPVFNKGLPSQHYRHVVVEVPVSDQSNDKFLKAGFYVVVGLDASQAGFLFERNAENHHGE